MSKEINPVSLSRMPKLEYPELVYTFVRIVDDYGADSMFISEPVEVLKSRLPELMLLNVTSRRNAESPVIKELLTKRRDILSAMVGQTKKLVKANLVSQVVPLKLLVPFVETYWSNIRTYNEKTINARVKFMFTEIDSKPELKAAFTSVGMLVHVDELRTIEIRLFDSREARRKSKSAEPKVDTKQIKSYVGEAMTDVINAIEIARKTHPEVDYKPMIKEINDLFVSYQSEVKAHSTRLKNATTTVAPSTTTTATAV